MPQLLTRPAFWLAAYLVLMNLVTFWVYGADKRRARRGRWRVPEKTLFLLPLLGGSIGALAGMRVFHHKTRHWYFRWGIPAIFLLQLAACGAVWYLSRLCTLPFLPQGAASSHSQRPANFSLLTKRITSANIRYCRVTPYKFIPYREWLRDRPDETTATCKARCQIRRMLSAEVIVPRSSFDR